MLKSAIKKFGTRKVLISLINNNVVRAYDSNSTLKVMQLSNYCLHEIKEFDYLSEKRTIMISDIRKYMTI